VVGQGANQATKNNSESEKRKTGGQDDIERKKDKVAGREGKDESTGEREEERVLVEVLQGTWREGLLGNHEVSERSLAPQGDNEKACRYEGDEVGDGRREGDRVGKRPF